MQGGHGFFDRGGLVEAVNLQEVDIGCVEASEGGFDGIEDGESGKTCVGEGVI